MSRPIFQLGARLQACADLVLPGAVLADVGTDHAYLPIWLIKTGKIPRALAMDIREGPLQAAAANAKRYQVTDVLTLRQSDGLENLEKGEADAVVMAGMGGGLILRLLTARRDLLTGGPKQWVLQPMQDDALLRRGLIGLGLSIAQERAVVDGRHVYAVMSVERAAAGQVVGDLYPWMGVMKPGTAAVTAYAQKVLRRLRKEQLGCRHRNEVEKADACARAEAGIIQRYLTSCHTTKRRNGDDPCERCL